MQILIIIVPKNMSKHILLICHCQSKPLKLSNFDSHLTERGCLEAETLELSIHPEVIIASSLTRTLETADIIRQRYGCKIVVHDGCRERCNLDPYNKRCTITELKTNFPSNYFDWSQLQSNRSSQFMKYISTRPERNILVITHQSFIQSLIPTENYQNLLLVYDGSNWLLNDTILPLEL